MDKIYGELFAPSGERIEIRRASGEDADELLALQERSIDKRVFYPITRDEIFESAEKDIILAAYASGKIIALNILVKNRKTDRSLAPDVGKDYSSVATFDGVIVAPEYRGLGLQRRFLAIAAELSRAWGAANLAATVAAPNLPSRSNFQKEGFTEIGEFPKYGATRIIVVKDL